jgi:tRNA threonylcarbamoyladenosine biosynthesis protein TsaB
MVEVSIDTASDIAGVALTLDGELIAEVTWRTRQNHSRELLPAFDWLLQRAGLARNAVSALFVCTGPGSYAGLRVGLSTAKALAYALDARIAGVGRLAADAFPFAVEPNRRVTAVHAAGRAELAWASYAQRDGDFTELSRPALGPREELLRGLRAGDIVCGDIDDPLVRAIADAGAVWSAPRASRVLSVARLGWRRLKTGDIDSADALVPLYLREPAIGPQRTPASDPTPGTA